MQAVAGVARWGGERCGRWWLQTVADVFGRVCSGVRVAGWGDWAASQFLRVCWNRSAFPCVCGWSGWPFCWVLPRVA